MRPGLATFLGILAALPVGVAAMEVQGHWSYSGPTGPAHWGSVKSDYALCRTGKLQSPINIERAQARADRLPPLAFSYSPAGAKVIDNGHTVEVEIAGGSALRVGSDRYSLVQFHFHRPSEETIDGKRYEMSVHFVHRDAAGHLAVVAVLVTKGAANPLFGKIWRSVSGNEAHHASPIGSINPLALLPTQHGYYAYPGSLTTPPCSQGVRWFVLKTPVTLSEAQIERFATSYPNNSRPVQPLNGRAVLVSK